MSPASTRRYRKRKRAEAEEQTRRRITEAAVELHGSVGPANTTVTELAERAGVSRMTVYNHFPSDVELYAACSSHWASQNPFPDPEDWAATDDPAERLHLALTELYAWYDAKQDMLGNTLRDAQILPPLEELMDSLWGGYIDAIVSVLEVGWRSDDPSDHRRPGAMLRVVVDFHTWQTLRAAELDNREAAEVACRMVAGATAATV